MIVHHEIIVTPDYPVVRIRQPRETTDLSVELPRVMNTQGWGIGTFFHVQFVSHDRTKLLASGLHVVCEETESLQTNEANLYQPMTKVAISRKCALVGSWWASEPMEPLPALGTPASIEHKGGGRFAVLDPVGAVLCTIGKDDGGRERAERIVAGSEPVPAQAA